MALLKGFTLRPKELGLKNEREYQEFLTGGPKNLQKAFSARQAFFAQRSGVQDDLVDYGEMVS